MTRGKTSDGEYVRSARQYVDDVLSGRVAACRWVRLACERQVKDLDRQKSGWQWKFDEKRADHFCRIAELLPHVEGRWPSKTINLQPWQCFRFTTIFGWVDERGARRFRKALNIVPRKNGKTSESAIVGLYLLGPEQEPGAQVFSAATTRDQARISWEIARKMVQRTPGFRSRFGIQALAHSITAESIGGFFKPLSREADSLEGLNVSGGIIDELHVHPNREVWDVLDNGITARQQPLIWGISTEGDQSTGIFVDQVHYLQQILEGNHDDESYFGIYYGLDEEDDWTLEKSWIKANPNWDVSVSPREMRDKYREAKQLPSAQATFLTKRLNVRVGAGNAYFNMLAWKQLCCDPSLKIEDFKGLPCIVTVDLASKSDLATWVAVFRRAGHYYIFGRYYLPESAIEPGRPNYDFYRGWQAKELLTVTSGARTDYEVIERDLLEFRDAYKPQQVGVDPNYNAEQFRQHMEAAGVPVIEVPHNIAHFSEPMKDLASLIPAGRVHCDGDQILTWTMGNVVAKTDAKDNVYPCKSRDGNKIDSAVSVIANKGLWNRLDERVSAWQLPEVAI